MVLSVLSLHSERYHDIITQIYSEIIVKNWRKSAKLYVKNSRYYKLPTVNTVKMVVLLLKKISVISVY